MAVLSRWLLLSSLLLVAAPRLHAAGSAETRAFDAATNALRDGLWERAEGEFGQFAKTYTNSAHLPEALLYQAQARINLTNFPGALELLSTNETQAGKLADEYLFWRAEALFRKGELAAAADSFAKMAHDFPVSQRALEATVRAGTARARLFDWSRVIELQTNAVFQSAASANFGSPEAAKQLACGYLLLGDAYLALSNCVAADGVLKPLAQLKLPPQFDWQRQYLLCRTLMADGRTAEALQNTTNLLALAAATGQRANEAESAAFQAGVFERLGRPEEAITAYQRNLNDTVPGHRQREALLKIAELFRAQGKIGEAAQMLERFLAKFPLASVADLASVTVGELRLQQYMAAAGTNLLARAETNSPAATNLVQALAALQGFSTRFPQSPLLGRSDLFLGWCFWLQHDWPASQAAFQAAVTHLPVSPEQAIAYFKLGDALFQQTQTNSTTNFTAAISNYKAVLDKFRQFPTVETNLFEPALYQIVRAGLAGGDLSEATNAVGKLLAWYPNGFCTDRAILLTGQALGEQNPAEARRLFLQLSQAVTNSALTPEIGLAIARTYEEEKQWDRAIEQYDHWLDTFTNHPAQPQAEYGRAMANVQAGRQTNALAQFTNLVARFPANPLALKAQWWVGDYYFQLPDVEHAEKTFQAIYQDTNCPARERYQAQMMAGRVALTRQSWNDAWDYFRRLAGNTNCDTELQAQAFFALGDTFVSQNSTNKAADYAQAISAYRQVTSLCPTSQIAVLATGARANCYLQIKEYTNALDSYQQVVDSPLADAAVRSSAKVGLGATFEMLAGQQSTEESKPALIRAALNEYEDVLEAKFLRDGEQLDPFWTRKAGQEAVRLHEGQQQFSQAIRICEHLQELFPGLRLDSKINALKAQQQLASQKE